MQELTTSSADVSASVDAKHCEFFSDISDT